MLLKMGEIIARNMLSWLELLINRYCCIKLVVCVIVKVVPLHFVVHRIPGYRTCWCGLRFPCVFQEAFCVWSYNYCTLHPRQSQRVMGTVLRKIFTKAKNISNRTCRPCWCLCYIASSDISCMKWQVVVRVVLSLNVTFFWSQYPGICIFLYTLQLGVTYQKALIL